MECTAAAAAAATAVTWKGTEDSVETSLLAN